MFWAILYPSSGARDYIRVITAYGVNALVAGGRMFFDGIVQHPSLQTHSLLLCT